MSNVKRKWTLSIFEAIKINGKFRALEDTWLKTNDDFAVKFVGDKTWANPTQFPRKESVMTLSFHLK